MFGMGGASNDQAAKSGVDQGSPQVIAPTAPVNPPVTGAPEPAPINPTLAGPALSASAMPPLDPINAAIQSLNATQPQQTAQPAVMEHTSTPMTPEIAPPAPTPSLPASPTDVSRDDLYAVKQQALSQLTPLVGHLDGTIEEQFDAYMMMIRATDDAKLIPPAYEVAKQITDEKRRAKALLDIVNEVNYLTQQHQEEE